MRNDSNETSVLVSLRELVALEDERVREEQAREAARHAQEIETRRARQEAARQAEEARKAAEEEARAERRRRDAEEAARLRAIEAAEVERARTEAAERAELERRKSELAHAEKLRAMELEASQRRNRRLLAGGAVVAVLAMVTAGFVYEASRPSPVGVAGTEPGAITPAHRRLLDQRLATLDRVHAQLRDRLHKLDAAPDALTARADEASELRAKMEKGRVTDAELDRFETSLEALRASLTVAQHRQHLASLDAIHGELKAAVARVRYPSDALKSAAQEAEAARGRIGAEPDEPALRAFSRSLRTLTKEAAGANPGGGRLPRVPTPPGDDAVVPSPEPCDPHDPMCGNLGI